MSSYFKGNKYVLSKINIKAKQYMKIFEKKRVCY